MTPYRRSLATVCAAAMLAVAPATVRASAAAHPPEAGAPAAEHHETGEYSLAEDLPFWGIVAFIGFLAALKVLGWDALTSGMKSREENETRLIGEAEKLREESAALLRANRGRMEALDEEVRAALAEADRDADYTRGDIRAAADREAATAQTRADAEIARVKDQSLHEIFETMADRVAAAAEQRIRTLLSPKDQEQLVEAAVSEFAAHGR